jgi:hypothetical protein
MSRNTIVIVIYHRHKLLEDNEARSDRGTVGKKPKCRKYDPNVVLGIANIVLLIEKRDHSVYSVCKFLPPAA